MVFYMVSIGFDSVVLNQRGPCLGQKARHLKFELGVVQATGVFDPTPCRG